MTQSMIRKILHSPISELKELARHPDGQEQVELIRKIFNVQGK